LARAYSFYALKSGDPWFARRARELGAESDD
jgi:hypothetical protein